MVERNQLNIKIATAFAGNLQSNRFLALVSNIDEYKKALEVANDSEGTGTLQFNKTLDNIETRLTKLKTAWQLFYTDSGIEKAIKNVITGLTNILNRLNKLPKLFKVIPLNALTMIASIISGVKLLAQVIANKIIAAIEQVREKARQAIHDTEQEANASADRTSQHIQNNGNGGATGRTSGNVGSSKGYKIASGVQIAGSALSLLGSSGILGKNEYINTGVSGLGTTLSLGATGFKMGGPWGAVLGSGLGVVLSIIDLFNVKAREAEQKLEELKQKADEAENKYLESKQTVSGLEDYVKQYQQMAKAQYDSNDAKQQFLDLNAEIAEKYPDLLIQYDAEGNKIIQLIDLQKQLNAEKKGNIEDMRNLAQADYKEAQSTRDNVKTNFISGMSQPAADFAYYKYWHPLSASDDKINNALSVTNRLAGINNSPNALNDTDIRIIKQFLSDDYTNAEIYELYGERAQQALEKARDAFGKIKDQKGVSDLFTQMYSFTEGLSSNFNKNNYISANNEFKTAQQSAVDKYMYTYHYDENLDSDDYSYLYNKAKKAGFDLDQYISNIIGNFPETMVEEWINNPEKMNEAFKLYANRFNQEILQDDYNSAFVGDIYNKSKAEIDKFKEENKEVYEALLDDNWKNLEENLSQGINLVRETMTEYDGSIDYNGLEEFITSSNLSLWREIAENDAEHFEDYYDLVAELAENNQFSIADITNAVLKADLSTMTGIQELENTLKTNGMYQVNQEKIEEFLKEARSKVKFNPALEFAAMLDSYTSAYEELDKLASSLSTGLELKDAISWAAKMGTSIDQFMQKEGKFFVSQEQFWEYANQQIPSVSDMVDKNKKFYESLQESGGTISGINPDTEEVYSEEQLQVVQGQYESWKNKRDKEGNQPNLERSFIEFRDEQIKNAQAEAVAAYKSLITNYAIQSIKTFGKISNVIEQDLKDAGYTPEQIKELEDKYLGSETTSTLFSTGKIDVANWDKLPQKLQEYVNKTTGQITDYGKALEALATGIEEGTIDPSYASIYAEGISTAKSDLEAALNGTLDGARVEILKTQGLINKYSLILDKETGKYKIDFSKYWGGYKLIVKNLMEDLNVSQREAIQMMVEGAITQGADVDKAVFKNYPEFTREYNYQLSQARKDAVEGLQDAVFDATKSIDISKLYQANKGTLDELAKTGVIRIEENGEKVAIQILGGTIERIIDLITMLGGEETEIDSSAIISTISSYFDQGLTGDLSKSAAEMLIKRLGLSGDFSSYFEKTSAGYKFKNNNIAKIVALKSTNLVGGLNRTVSQFETNFNNLIKAGYTVDETISMLGEVFRTAAEIMKNGPQNEYERVIYNTYKDVSNNVYSSLVQSLTDTVSEIDLTKLKSSDRELYNELIEGGYVEVIETAEGEVYGYIKSSQADLIQFLRQKGISTGNTTILDGLSDYYETVAKMITDGINGDLTETNIKWLKERFKDANLTFIKAGKSFRMTEESAWAIVSALEKVDEVSSNITLDTFIQSMIETHYQLQSVSYVAQQIQNIEKEMITANEKDKKVLQQKLDVYKKILEASQSSASSFNIMNNPLVDGADNVVEAYKGYAQARKLIEDMMAGNDKGLHLMDYENAIRIMEVNREKFTSETRSWAQVLAMFDDEVIDTIDGNVVVNMEALAGKLEVSFEDFGSSLLTGSKEAVQDIAKSQIELIDGQINMLKAIELMENLTTNGPVDLTGWLKVDKDGNVIQDLAADLGILIGKAKEAGQIDGGFQIGENGLTLDALLYQMKGGTENFEAWLNGDGQQFRADVQQFFKDLGLDFTAPNFDSADTNILKAVTDGLQKLVNGENGEGTEVSPEIKITVKTDGTFYYIEGDETPYADLTELGTALAAKLGVEGLTIPEDPFSQTIPMDSKPNVNITCTPEGKWFVNGAETTEENLPTAIRNAMSIDQQNIGTNNDTVYGDDDVQVKMKVAGAASYIVGNQEGDEESAKNALKEEASLNNQSVGDDSSTLTGNINATVNTSIHFDGANYTADGIDGTFDTKDKVADAIADKYKVDSRTLKEQIGKYNIPVNGSLDISFQTITPSYIVNGESLGTYDEATDAIAAGHEVENKTLPEKTADLDLPVNSTLDISFQTVAPSYTVGDKVSKTFDEAADTIGTRAGIEDKKLDPKTITVTQDAIVNFKATLKDAEGNPIDNENGLNGDGITVKVAPKLNGFATAILTAIQKETYKVMIEPAIGDAGALQKAIQDAIDAVEYNVKINPNLVTGSGATIGKAPTSGYSVVSGPPSSKKDNSSSTSTDTSVAGLANILKETGLGEAISNLTNNLLQAKSAANDLSTKLSSIVPSTVSSKASSATTSLNNLATSIESITETLETMVKKIKKAADGVTTGGGGGGELGSGAGRSPSSVKGSVALATGTLMGELGPELWVSGGHYYIAGQGGAEFVNLPDDAIVFNHLQTRSLLANGNTTRGRAIKGEDQAVAFAKGSPEGPARASTSETIKRLEELRSLWQGLLDLPASDLSKKAGGGGGGGGAEDYKTFTADLERWYNLLRQIANYEQKITYEQKQRENFKYGQDYVDSLEKELKYLEKQADAYATLSELQKSYYDQRRKDLNNTQYGKLIFTYTEDGLMQYLDDVVDANGNKQSRGLAILAELNRQSNERGQSYWDKEGKNLYKGTFTAKSGKTKQTIDGSKGGAAAQLMYLKSVGFDLNELLYDSEGSSNVGKNAAETATNMMQTFFDNVDGWMEELDGLYDSYHEYLEKIEDNTAAQQKILQEYIDNQISVEDKLLKAITDRQQKIIDTLKDQIDIIQEAGQEYTQGLSEALSKERNLYNENKDDAELASKMRRLGILQRTGASASEIKALQNEIDNQLQENYFDAQQKQIDAIQEAIDTQLETLNKQLSVMEEALNYQKENGLLWAEVYEMMAEWTPEAMLNFIETYTSSYRENSQQKNSEDSKETLKQLEIWAASRGFDFSREPHKGNSKDYTKPDTSNDVNAPDMPRPSGSGGTTTGGGTSGGSSGSGTSTMANGLAAPQDIDVENTGVNEDRTLTPTVRQVSKSGVIDIYKVGGYYTKKDGTHGKYAWEVNGKLPAGKYYDFNGEIYRNPGAKHRRIIYSATSGKVYYVYDNTYLPNAKKISSYSSGGMNYSTGMAMLHGTSSKPEAILNANDTKLFREKLFGNGDFSLRQAIATIDLLRDQIVSTTNNSSSVDFNGVTINISSDVIANDYDAQRAGRNIFDEMIKMSRKSTMLGVSRR